MAAEAEMLGGNALPGILILTHGRFGEELIRSAEMIVGPMEGVVAVSCEAEDEPLGYQRRVQEAFSKLPHGSILLADLFGGTPSNTAAMLSRELEVNAISGVNLPMLIAAISLRHQECGRELARAVEGAARDSVRNITELMQSANADCDKGGTDWQR